MKYYLKWMWCIMFNCYGKEEITICRGQFNHLEWRPISMPDLYWNVRTNWV